MSLQSDGSTTLRVATTSDAALLARLGASAFRDTFAAENTPSDMALYLADAFGEHVQRAELADPRHVVFLAERAGEAIGYAMLRAGGAPDVVRGFGPIEIARLYAIQRLIGAGIGAALMQHCLRESAARGHDTVWLGVWEHNARAMAFYRRWGFEDVGSQTFMLGRDRQTDRVMMRPVAQEA